MKNESTASLFYREALKVAVSKELLLPDKIESLYRLLSLLYVEVTRHERLQFTTLFARISYVCHKREVSNRNQYYIHTFRKSASQMLIRHDPAQKPDGKSLQQLYQLGLRVVADNIAFLYDCEIPEELSRELPQEGFFPYRPIAIREFIPYTRVVALQDDPGLSQLTARESARPDQLIRIQYNIADRNENFNPSIEVIRKSFGFPVTLNLLDVEVDKEGIYRPRAFVIEPDYLVDVTSIAECFKDKGAEPILYLLKKYLPFESSPALMIGNIANYFLDELMTHPEESFREMFPKVFRLNPLAFSLFDEKTVKEIQGQSQRHFATLKTMVGKEFAEHGIAPDNCFLEPSFYSERYGIQGRLDVFHKDSQSKQSAIVELKSGKLFNPNAFGINQNHFIQTALYDLLIESVFEKALDPANYILYSGLDAQQLRFAPVSRVQQYEALQIRNQIVGMEQTLTMINGENTGREAIFYRLNSRYFGHLRGYDGSNIQQFELVFNGMTPLERKYFIAFSSFIAREHQLAKTGMEGVENANGVASLWLNDSRIKEDNFEMLQGLQILQNHCREDDPLLVFKRTEKTNPLANFRNGDVVVLYPADDPDANVLKNQIFKCTLTQIGSDTLSVRLRSKQFNGSLFENTLSWNIEHDMFDSTFNGMYRGLFDFARASADRKELLLTLRPPRQAELAELSAPAELTAEQQDIFRKIVSAPDYFLLWGPPGTGKTSMMLKHLVGWLMENTGETLLLLAFTNRAVDEICEAIDSIGGNIRDQYLRIGSRYSTAARFHNQLLDQKIEQIRTRKDLREVIQQHRIFVATVASMNGKQELFQLRQFDRIIVDEASQILEPMLAGLLTKYQRFVLIGDHQQLPAVVTQNPDFSKVNDPEMQQIGLKNLRDSLFERLYKRCIEMEWDWAYSRLSHQGRMHRDIMQFPNEHFYMGGLQILPQHMSYSALQTTEIEYRLPEDPTALETLLCSRRMVFLPSKSEPHGKASKTNAGEARLVCEIVRSFRRIYQKNGLSIQPNSIGVITPYRAQIARILKALHENGDDPSELTIDTVERYQGGARDIILISLCINNASQLYSLVSLSDEGIDRKLNVALTRARKHLIILGDPELLKDNPVYRRLMDAYSV